MQRVESVVEILQCFAVVSLSALIQPDRNERQQSDALPGDEMNIAQDGDLVSVSAQHFKVDVPHTDQLSQVMPPLFAPEEVEGQQNEDSGVIIVYKGDQTANIGYDKCGDSDQYSFPNLLGLGFFVPVNESDGNQKAPQHILMYWKEHPASHHQIKRDFRDHSEQEQPRHIFL